MRFGHRTVFGQVFALGLLAAAGLGGCRVAVTDCGTSPQAEESAWQLRRAGFGASVERCGRGALVTVPRWDVSGARGAVGTLGLPRRRLAVPAPDVGMWPSPTDRLRLERHETGARAAAIIQGLPQVEDAWVELRREGSGEVATATVVMREGVPDWVQVERVIRGVEGLAAPVRLERVGATLPSLGAGPSWAKVGPFLVAAAQASLFRWSIVGALVVVFVISALLAVGARRGGR